MTCPRCKGLIVQEDYFELRDGDRRFAIWRCILCGEIVDPIISANRKRQGKG